MVSELTNFVHQKHSHSKGIYQNNGTDGSCNFSHILLLRNLMINETISRLQYSQHASVGRVLKNTTHLHSRMKATNETKAGHGEV